MTRLVSDYTITRLHHYRTHLIRACGQEGRYSRKRLLRDGKRLDVGNRALSTRHGALRNDEGRRKLTRRVGELLHTLRERGGQEGCT